MDRSKNTFNQTRMELKLDSPDEIGVKAVSFNQTRMELKLKLPSHKFFMAAPFNQTRMELKLLSLRYP